MSRHCLVACVVALACTVTAVVLAEAGVFEGAGRWLFRQYVAESLLKGDGSVSWRWLHPAAAGVAALVVAWVAVDAVPWSTRTVVFAVAGLMVAFLSLTLALYGVSFNPLPSLLAATLAWLTGGLLAETPGGRREREWQRVIGDRLAPATVAEWRKTGEPLPLDPEVHEGAVLAVRILDPLPTAAKAAAHLAAMRRVLDEAAEFLHARGGAVLDVPSGDGVRAFFGLGPKPAATGAEEAAETALALAGFLKEEATLAAQGGRPALACGMGLSFGWLLCGNHGPARGAFWTATGPTAEQARQLAALNARHGTRILVGRRLAERIRDRFDLRPVDGEAVQSLVAARAAPSADEGVADLPEPEPTEEPERHPPADATPAAGDPMPPSPSPSTTPTAAAEPVATDPVAPDTWEESRHRRKRHKPGPSLD